MKAEELKKAAKQSIRYPFIAAHRGGPLTKEDHRELIRWARECCEHVLPLLAIDVDDSLIYALTIAREWENDNASTGAAMKVSVAAHSIVKQLEDPVYKAFARSVGHAVATAHMADHSLGAAFYALKAVKLAGKDFEKERNWQFERLKELTPGLIGVVQTMWKKKGLDQRI